MSDVSRALETLRARNQRVFNEHALREMYDDDAERLAQTRRKLHQRLGVPEDLDDGLGADFRGVAEDCEAVVARFTEDAKRFAEMLAPRAGLQLGLDNDRLDVEYIQSGTPNAFSIHEPLDRSYAIGVDLRTYMRMSRILPIIRHTLTVPESQRLRGCFALLGVFETETADGRRQWGASQLDRLETTIFPLYTFPEPEVHRLVTRSLEFVIAHELGHIALRHWQDDLDARLNPQRGLGRFADLSLLSRLKQQELDADRWAATTLRDVYGDQDEAARMAPEIFCRTWAVIERMERPQGVLAELAAYTHPPFGTRAAGLREAPFPHELADCYKCPSAIQSIAMLLHAFQVSPLFQLCSTMKTSEAIPLPSMPDMDGASGPHNSHYDKVELQCPFCGAGFCARLWVLVDAQERPDLLIAAAKGILHSVACPHCRRYGRLDAPLLIYVPGHRPPIFISPREASGIEEGSDEGARLLAKLHSSLGTKWDPRWGPRDSLPVMPGQRQLTLLKLATSLGLSIEG